jgi:hypothetical protein
MFKSAYGEVRLGFYAETYPRTPQFIAGPLKSMAGYILAGSGLVDVVAVDEASDAQLIAELARRGYAEPAKRAD